MSVPDPEIIVGIPGRWESREAIIRALLEKTSPDINVSDLF